MLEWNICRFDKTLSLEVLHYGSWTICKMHNGYDIRDNEKLIIVNSGIKKLYDA